MAVWGHLGLVPSLCLLGTGTSKVTILCCAIAVLTLIPESIKDLGKVQSLSWAWEAPEEVRRGHRLEDHQPRAAGTPCFLTAFEQRLSGVKSPEY